MQPVDIYLDNNASTAMLPEVQQAFLEALGLCGANPASAHAAGRALAARLEQARQSVASFIGARPEQIAFNSGGTEGNNAALHDFARQYPGGLVVLSAVEHPSVLAPAQRLGEQGQVALHQLAVDSCGLVGLGALEERLVQARANAQPVLVCVQWANGESGVVQPVAAIGELCRRHGARFLCDAAQALGRVPVDVGRAGADYLSFSAHKLHGPPGVGALFVREPHRAHAQLAGGAQEHGLRAGTPNTPAILAMACALLLRQERWQADIARLEAMREQFEQGLQERLEAVHVNGQGAPRTPQGTNVRFAGVDGQALVARLEARGVLCSQSSACHSHRPSPSPVLLAMGLSEDEAFESVRFAFSVLNRPEEVERALEAIAQEVGALRRFRDFLS